MLTRAAALTEDPMGAVYYAILQGEGVEMEWLVARMSYDVKTSVPPTSIVPAIRRALSELDAGFLNFVVRSTLDLTEGAAEPLGLTRL